MHIIFGSVHGCKIKIENVMKIEKPLISGRKKSRMSIYGTSSIKRGFEFIRKIGFGGSVITFKILEYNDSFSFNPP